MFGGGFGFGGSGGGARAPVNNTELYETLGVNKDATETEIKKSYRKLAMIHHPDKGGDADKFHKIQAAYEILSDENKRSLYDQAGLDGVENGGMSDSGMDIFDLFGGGGRRRGGAGRKQRGEDTTFPLKVSLNELYNGVTKKLRLTRDVTCTGCKGAGGVNAEACPGCRGQGVRVQMRQIGPGMVSQSQVTCTPCSGSGKHFPQGKCTECTGKCVVKEKKDLEVVIPRGALDGHVCKFAGEADQRPNTIPGDVLVNAEVKPHELFELKGYHLVMKHRISLNESLTGFAFQITHLDGRILNVVYDVKSSGAVKPGQYLKIVDEGMHRIGSVDNGNLYIQFEVVYPSAEWFREPKNITQLRTILPQAARPVNYTSNVTLVSCDLQADISAMTNEINREKARRQQAEDDDEGHYHQGGQQTSCQAM